jgi:carboxyl-terminal processing protease
VAYLRFSVFFDPPTLMPWFRERVISFAGAPGLIIDLRGNPGGIGGMAMGMGNMLVDKPNQKLGTMTTRETAINFVLNPQVGRYTGPVAVLIDELSMSTSEILAGGLQAIGRARVFGVRTPGMALPSQVVKLPSGDGFQFATANYVSADGKVLEGHGVEPDQEVRQEVKALLEGRDVVVEAAEAWIRSQQNQTGG